MKVPTMNDRVRVAAATDIEWIESLLVDMRDGGHLTNTELVGKIGRLIAGDILTVRSSASEVKYRCDVWVAEFQHVPVAAAVIKMRADASAVTASSLKSEIWVFGVRECFQKQRHGHKFLQSIKDIYPSPGLFVRCAESSKDFVRLAEKSGFGNKEYKRGVGTYLDWQG